MNVAEIHFDFNIEECFLATRLENVYFSQLYISEYIKQINGIWDTFGNFCTKKLLIPLELNGCKIHVINQVELKWGGGVG